MTETVDLSDSVPSRLGPPTPNDPSRRCQAHKKTGEQCRLPAIPGGRVCPKHGGAAPHVKAKALVRIEMAAAKAAQELIDMTTDYALDYRRPDVRLAAIKDVLDRGGIGRDQQINVNVESKPFERILAGLSHLSREDSRRAREQKQEEALDVEVVEDGDVVQENEPESSGGTSGFERLARKRGT